MLPREGIGWNALRLLPLARDRRVLPALLGRFGHEDLDEVCEAVAAHRDPRAIPALAERLAKMKKKRDRARIEAVIDALRSTAT
jgi:hypothetical protein